MTKPIEKTEKKNSLINLVLILLGILALLLLAGSLFLGWQYLQLNNEVSRQEQVIERQNIQKDSLQNEIEFLKTEIRKQQDLHNVEVENVIGQLENLKVSLRSNSGGESLNKYKAEVKRLKEEIATFQEQAEAWRLEEAEYKQQLDIARSDMKVLDSQNQSLESDKKMLTEKVESGAVLQISDIAAHAFFVNKKGKEKALDKARKVNKLECCFTVFRNSIAEKGERTAYLIIKEPGGKIIKSDKSALFESTGGLMNYTAMSTFNYDGQDTKLCIDIDLKDDLEKGNYLMEVYIDKNYTSEQKIELK